MEDLEGKIKFSAVKISFESVRQRDFALRWLYENKILRYKVNRNCIEIEIDMPFRDLIRFIRIGQKSIRWEAAENDASNH